MIFILETVNNSRQECVIVNDLMIQNKVKTFLCFEGKWRGVVFFAEIYIVSELKKKFFPNFFQKKT